MKTCKKCGTINIDRQKTCIMCGENIVFDIKAIDANIKENRDFINNRKSAIITSEKPSPSAKIIRPVVLTPIKSNSIKSETALTSSNTTENINKETPIEIDSNKLLLKNIMKNNPAVKSTSKIPELKNNHNPLPSETISNSVHEEETSSDTTIKISKNNSVKHSGKDRNLTSTDFLIEDPTEPRKKKKRLPVEQYDGYYDSLLPEDFGQNERFNLDTKTIFNVIGLLIVGVIVMFLIYKYMM